MIEASILGGTVVKGDLRYQITYVLYGKIGPLRAYFFVRAISEETDGKFPYEERRNFGEFGNTRIT